MGSQDIILQKANRYAHCVYKLSKQLPKEEQFGLTSQLRRAAISVALNIVEGYARQSRKSEAQFLAIAYGSLKESQYILEFATEENCISSESTRDPSLLGEEVAKMIWSKIKTLQKHQEK